MEYTICDYTNYNKENKETYVSDARGEWAGQPDCVTN